MSEEELLLGQVSLALLGLSNALFVLSLWRVRSSDGPELGLPIIFWAGPHNAVLAFFLSLFFKFFKFLFLISELKENKKSKKKTFKGNDVVVPLPLKSKQRT